MNLRRGQRTAGFSLVELLVVVAVIAILLGISVPVLSAFSQNDMDRGARELYTLIRAARVYATTYNVKTAVAYELDGNPVGDPVRDTLRDAPVRTIRAAAVLYQLPAGMGSFSGKYVASTEHEGAFKAVPTGYSVLLDVPPAQAGLPPPALAFPYGAPWEPTTGANANIGNIGLLGMSAVTMYDGYIDEDPALRVYDPAAVALVLAHEFDTGGRLITSDKSNATTQRFRILFAPSPDRPVEERVWSVGTPEKLMVDSWWQKQDPNAGPEMGLLGIPIEIYRSTGRVRMGSL